VERYIKDINGFPLINKSEEISLALRIKNGDLVSREKLIVSNLRLVVKIAHDFKGIGLSIEDLIAEGNIGLIRASEKFVPSKGVKFSTYAAWWIKQSMRKALTEKSKTIRIPTASNNKINKIKNVKNELFRDLKRPPTRSEISKATGESEKTIARLERVAVSNTVSLDASVSGEFSLKDFLSDECDSPDSIAAKKDTIFYMRKIMAKTLTAREIIILEMRFGLDGNGCRTLEEISQKIGRTRERIRQIQVKSLKTLKDVMKISIR